MNGTDDRSEWEWDTEKCRIAENDTAISQLGSDDFFSVFKHTVGVELKSQLFCLWAQINKLCFPCLPNDNPPFSQILLQIRNFKEFEWLLTIVRDILLRITVNGGHFDAICPNFQGRLIHVIVMFVNKTQFRISSITSYGMITFMGCVRTIIFEPKKCIRKNYIYEMYKQNYIHEFHVKGKITN